MLSPRPVHSNGAACGVDDPSYSASMARAAFVAVAAAFVYIQHTYTTTAWQNVFECTVRTQLLPLPLRRETIHELIDGIPIASTLGDQNEATTRRRRALESGAQPADPKPCTISRGVENIPIWMTTYKAANKKNKNKQEGSTHTKSIGHSVD